MLPQCTPGSAGACALQIQRYLRCTRSRQYLPAPRGTFLFRPPQFSTTLFAKYSTRYCQGIVCLASARCYSFFSHSHADTCKCDTVTSPLFYTRSGTEGNYTIEAPHGLEACGYNGAFEALEWIHNKDSSSAAFAPPAALQDPNALIRFDQTEFDVPRSGLDRIRGGFAYIPRQCWNANTATTHCSVHVFVHGCGMAAYAGPTPYAFNDTYARRAGFNEVRWLQSTIDGLPVATVLYYIKECVDISLTSTLSFSFFFWFGGCR